MVRDSSTEPKHRLLSRWQAIADFFNKDVRTVKRWASERGLPVHRVRGRKRATIYADAAELEAWLKGRHAASMAREVGGPSPTTIASGPASQARDQDAAARALFENVPLRDLTFTGREQGLQELHALFSDSQNPRAARLVAIHGLGGLGKSSLAAEYAHRYADAYSGVWWAPASQRALLIESLTALARHINPRLAETADQEKAAVAALAQLSRGPRPFLLIYDDVDTPETIQDLVPLAGARIIITSRWADWSGRAASLKLDAFDEQTATEFLQKRADRPDPDGSRMLAHALGNLPLALDHAGAYCRLTATSFEAYHKRIDTLLSQAPPGAARAASVVATFGLAIEMAASRSPDADTLLSLFAYLAPDNAPLSEIARDLVGEDASADAVAALTALSLIEHGAAQGGGATVTVHPLVQGAMRARLAARGEAAAALEKATKQLARIFPADPLNDPKSWPLCGSLLGHAIALRSHANWGERGGESAARLLHSAGDYLYIRGAHKEAEALLSEAIAITARAPAHARSALTEQQFSRARALFFMGRLTEAEDLFRETIAATEQRFGRGHINTAIKVGLLAELLTHTKRFDEAEPLFREIVAIADKPENAALPYDVVWRDDLGILLDDRGRYAESEVVYREAIAIGEKKLGRAHPEFARCLNNLGRVLRDLGRYGEAEPLVREAIAIWRETRGADDIYAARGQRNLAIILMGLQRAAEALPLIENALAIHEAALGAAHFWTQESAQTRATVCAAINNGSAAPQAADPTGEARA